MPHATAPSAEVQALQTIKCPQFCRLGQYYIATGEHTNIWLAKMITETRSHEIVALKEIRSASGTDSLIQTTERLHQYINIGQRLRHPNISHAYGLVDGHGAVPFLVMPYFPNGNIVHYLKNHRSKTNKDKIELGKGILNGLVYLHDREVIHGSIHSSNVLINDSGSPVLCDIQMDTVPFTDDGYYSIHSKCWWMPHERLIEGDSEDQCSIASPSKPADIYAVALTILQIWTLQRPFSHIRHPYKLITALQKFKSNELVGLERPEQVPEDVWAVLYDCLKVNPQSRPTATTLLERFQAL